MGEFIISRLILHIKIIHHLLSTIEKFYEGKEKYCFTSEDSWAILEQADLKFAKKITIIMTDIKVKIEEL